MEIPGNHILDGMCVALYKSSFEQKETYFRSPLQMAENFARQGAEKILLADLNGKMKKTFEQREIIGQVIKNIKIPVLVEAGFGNTEDIQAALDLGAAQVILRSPAPDFVRTVIEKFGAEKIVIELQSKGSELINGGKTRPDQVIDVVDYAEKLVPLGVKNIIYKDERSEGTMIHPNYDDVDRLYLTTGRDLKIYVAGGISDPAHLRLLKKIGASGAVIGKAFYEKRLTVAEAQAAVKD